MQKSPGSLQDPGSYRAPWSPTARHLESGQKNWWRRRESNPRPQALRLWLYMLIRSIYLIAGYPTGRENRQRAWQGFNESAPGALHRDPISGDSRYPVVWARSRAEGFTQVFKLLKRSCRRWQLKFCNQFYELSAARHAPRVSLPTSKPGRPH